MKILIIVNPHSRKNKETNCVSIDKFKKIGGNLVEVKATQTLAELDKVISSACKNKGAYLGISGGDGTIHNVLSHIIKIYPKNKIPPILLLGDGTMNNIASSINMKGNSEKLLKKFVKKLRTSKKINTLSRDTMDINGQYGLLFGFGLVTNFLNAVYKDGKNSKRKSFKVILKLIREIFKSRKTFGSDELELLKPVNANILVDGKKMLYNEILVSLIGTVEIIGMGFKTLYRANEQQGKFHLLLSAIEPIKIFTNLHKIKYGIKIKHEKHIDELASEMVIDCKDELEYTIDGDMYKTNKKLKIQMGPRIDFITLK